MWEPIHRLRENIDGFLKTFASKAAILMYHRVLDRDLDSWSLCVSPQHFAEHLEILRKHAHPISLTQLVQAHRERSIPDRAVAVTFDDGYYDNLHNAKPVLEQYSIPATVFVASGSIAQERAFWWDELEQIFLKPGTLPEFLDININGKQFHWDLADASHYSDDDYRKHSGWTVNYHNFPTVRHSLYLTLHQLLQPLMDSDIKKAMNELRAWSGLKAASFSTNRTLSKEELLLLEQGELITIGAHTHTHPFLSMLSKSQQQDEIVQNKIALEECFGKPVYLFAYPYGNYTKQTIRIVQKAGFACACTIDGKCVWHGSHRYLLPRITITNCSGEEFLSQLDQILQ